MIRAPRCIPDERFDELFAQLGSHRDRALVAFWVSTGARAAELLGATVADVDPGQQLITVIRKGTRVLQPLPAAPDAFVWLRLYQAQLQGLVPAGRDEPLWWTLRRPFRALRYDAARAMFTRANAALGVELVATRSSAHGGVSDGPRPRDAADRRAVGAGARASVDHPAVSEPGDRGGDRGRARLPRPATRSRADGAAGGGIPRARACGSCSARTPSRDRRQRAADTATDADAGPAATRPAATRPGVAGAQLVAAFPPRPAARRGRLPRRPVCGAGDGPGGAFSVGQPGPASRPAGWGCWRS